MTRFQGAAAVVLHRNRALLVQRRNPPDAGLWGYPGGHVNPGECVKSAAIRELREETGVIGSALEVLTVLNIGDETRWFDLAMVLCDYVSGQPRAADDAMAADWVPVASVLRPDRPMSDGVADVLRRAMRT